MKACPACNTRYDDNTTYCVRDGNPVVPDVLQPQAPMIGQLIGERYKIIRKLGEGGMGEVYVAEHIHIEKRVALKLLRPEVLSNQEAVQRFRQEARSASSIGHENIIQIDDFGTLPDGRIYMAMEYLQGAPLNDILAREVVPLPRALDILIQTARGLAAAHAKGITHRDMKPENIYVTNRDGKEVPKILDFGIAKVSGGDTAQNLTVAGTIFGTPFYMAPEQAMGGKMDHRVDVYAMGIILYEIFTGTVPFKAETFMGILTQHITQPPVPPSQMAAQNGRVCPPELENIILKAMRKEPADRYQTMNELTSALIEFYRFACGPQAVTMAPWAPSVFGRSGTSSVPAVYQTGPMSAQRAASGGGSKTWVLVAIAAFVVLGGGGAAAIVMSRGEDRPVVSPEPERGKTGQPEPPPVTAGGAPDAAPVILAKAEPDAGGATTVAVTGGAPDAGTTTASTIIDSPPVDRTPPARQVDVTIVSKPDKAAVFDVTSGRTYVGVTPLIVQVRPGQRSSFRIELAGYHDRTIRVDGGKKIENVSLSRRLRDTNPELKGLEDDDLATPRVR
jgi:eukaryotic-like serine/threonine-protein kinase